MIDHLSMEFDVSFACASFIAHDDRIEVIEECDEDRKAGKVGSNGNVAIECPLLVKLKKSGGEGAVDCEEGETRDLSDLIDERVA